MHKYSPAAITYISLNIISLSLLTYIIIKLCISSNNFTKYTQFQLFIASWGYTIGCLPSIIIYGDDIINKLETQVSSICVIQQMISLFFFYPLHLFPVVLGFYTWNAIENQNMKIEKKYFWTFTSLIWCFAVCYNVFSLADGYKKDIHVTPLLCKPPNSNLHKVTYLMIISPLFCMSLIFICFTATMLWKHWKEFSMRKNRWTLLICGVIYVSLLGISSLSRITSQYVKHPENSEVNKIIIEDFVQPFIGITLFLIFVINDSPTIFLSCFYYDDPESPISKSEDDDLYARPPSLISSSGINQLSIIVEQVTTITSHTIQETSSTNNNEIQMELLKLEGWNETIETFISSP